MKQKRVYWLCEFCWSVFSTKRSAKTKDHDCAFAWTNSTKVKGYGEKPIKLVEAE